MAKSLVKETFEITIDFNLQDKKEEKLLADFLSFIDKEKLATLEKGSSEPSKDWFKYKQIHTKMEWRKIETWLKSKGVLIEK